MQVSSALRNSNCAHSLLRHARHSKTCPCAGGYNYPIYTDDDRLIIGNRDEATVQCDQACQEVSKNQTLCADSMVSSPPSPRWLAMRLSGFEMALPSPTRATSCMTLYDQHAVGAAALQLLRP